MLCVLFLTLSLHCACETGARVPSSAPSSSHFIDLGVEPQKEKLTWHSHRAWRPEQGRRPDDWGARRIPLLPGRPPPGTVAWHCALASLCCCQVVRSLRPRLCFQLFCGLQDRKDQSRAGSESSGRAPRARPCFVPNASPGGPTTSGLWSQVPWAPIPLLLLTNWASHSTTLNLGVLICKMGIGVAPTSRSCGEGYVSSYNRVWYQY